MFATKGKPKSSVTEKPSQEPIPAEGPTCNSCIFHASSECHRFPPIAGALEFVHPIVKPCDWCGEYREKIKCP
jgi:hypothetical protein